jgi:hypothetical protein
LPGLLKTILTEKVVASIDSWTIKLSDIMTSSSSYTIASGDSPSLLKAVAVLVGKLTSWVNHWLGFFTSSSRAAPVPVAIEKHAASAGSGAVDTCT